MKNLPPNNRRQLIIKWAFLLLLALSVAFSLLLGWAVLNINPFGINPFGG